MTVNIEWRYVGDAHWLYLCTMSESRAPAGLAALRAHADALSRRDNQHPVRPTEYRIA